MSSGAIQEFTRVESRSPGRIRKSRTGEDGQHTNGRTHIIAEKLMIDSSEDEHKMSADDIDPPEEIYVSNSKLNHG